MYFLNPLLLCSAFIAAQDIDQDASISEYLNTTPATPTPPPGSIKTILVTVTRTIYPVPPYPPPTIVISSQLVAPPPFTQGEQPGESSSPTSDSAEWPARHRYTSLAMPNYHTASFAAYKGDANVTGKPMFTLNTASPSIPSEGRYTSPTLASMHPSSSSNNNQNAPDEHLDSENVDLSATNDADMDNEYRGMENLTAWSGTDNAIPAQMHDPPLQSTSGAVQCVRRVWDSFGQDTQGEKRGEKRGCRPCIGEGTVLCQGDVGIGYCKGGCEALQFLGRGHGCSGSSAARLWIYTEGAVAVIAAVVYFMFAF